MDNRSAAKKHRRTSALSRPKFSGAAAPRFEQEITEETEYMISVCSVYSVDSIEVGSRED